MALSVAERSRRYRLAHPERAKAACDLWVEKHRARVNAKNARWHRENPASERPSMTPEKKAAKAKRYALRHKGHLRAYQQARCAERRAWLDSLKAAPCVDCGGRFPPVAMDFDHVRGVKERCVGNLFNVAKERAIAEIAKCDLVCSNCHRVRTQARRVASKTLAA